MNAENPEKKKRRSHLRKKAVNPAGSRRGAEHNHDTNQQPYLGKGIAYVFMNRRIPNGTYGGVGGRELGAPSYPIYLTNAFCHD